MAVHDLNGVKVAVVVSDMFEQIEYTEPRLALEEAGAIVTLIAPAKGEVQGAKHDEKVETFDVDLTISEASPDDFDALLLPGGTMSSDQLRTDDEAQEFVKSFDEAEKPIAVICHGAWLLVSAKLVKGRTMTSYPSIKDDIENAGGHWEDAEVVVEHNLVSSRKPDDIPAFNREMLALLAENNVAKAYS